MMNAGLLDSLRQDAGTAEICLNRNINTILESKYNVTYRYFCL
jgi:hypothetical protein